MAKPEKNFAKRAFEYVRHKKASDFIKENKWTCIGTGAAWMVGIPLVPGVAELAIGGGAGAYKDYRDRKKEAAQKKRNRNRGQNGPRSIWKS